MTTGIPAFAARSRTLGQLELSVGEMTMPATLRAITSWALRNCFCALFSESSAWNS